jgi:putative RecB family exonuclease
MKTGIDFDAETVFSYELSKAWAIEENKSGFKLEDWYWSGRQKPETSMEWWQANGAALVRNYIDWYETHPDVRVWTTPDGQPAIELELTVQFGEIPVKMAIDQVLLMGSALVVVDLKTSAKAPENPRQLGIYACGIEKKYGIRPKYGAYFLPRDPMRYFQRPVCLDEPQYGIEYLTKEFAMMEKGRSEGIFVANPGRACGRCGVAHACLAAGGAQARKLDPAHPAHGRSALAP